MCHPGGAQAPLAGPEPKRLQLLRFPSLHRKSIVYDGVGKCNLCTLIAYIPWSFNLGSQQNALRRWALGRVEHVSGHNWADLTALQPACSWPAWDKQGERSVPSLVLPASKSRPFSGSGCICSPSVATCFTFFLPCGWLHYCSTGSGHRISASPYLRDMMSDSVSHRCLVQCFWKSHLVIFSSQPGACY